jgi:hypothetical protein
VRCSPDIHNFVFQETFSKFVQYYNIPKRANSVLVPEEGLLFLLEVTKEAQSRHIYLRYIFWDLDGVVDAL